MLTVTGILGVSAATFMAASSVVYLSKTGLPSHAQNATTSVIRPTNSTLLFIARPASLALLPTGARCANPAVCSRGAPI